MSGRAAWMNSLITGGTGYIGSHACVALARAGHEQPGSFPWTDEFSRIARREA